MLNLKQIAIAFDQLINTLFGGFADETISARAYRRGTDGHKGWNRVRLFIDGLFFFERGHCYQSWLAELERKQLPTEYRN